MKNITNSISKKNIFILFSLLCISLEVLCMLGVLYFVIYSDYITDNYSFNFHCLIAAFHKFKFLPLLLVVFIVVQYLIITRVNKNRLKYVLTFFNTMSLSIFYYSSILLLMTLLVEGGGGMTGGKYILSSVLFVIIVLIPIALFLILTSIILVFKNKRIKPQRSDKRFMLVLLTGLLMILSVDLTSNIYYRYKRLSVYEKVQNIENSNKSIDKKLSYIFKEVNELRLPEFKCSWEVSEQYVPDTVDCVYIDNQLNLKKIENITIIPSPDRNEITYEFNYHDGFMRCYVIVYNTKKRKIVKSDYPKLNNSQEERLINRVNDSMFKQILKFIKS